MGKFLFIKTHCTVNCTFERGHGVLQPQAQTSGARAIMLSHIEFQGCRGEVTPQAVNTWRLGYHALTLGPDPRA